MSAILLSISIIAIDSRPSVHKRQQIPLNIETNSPKAAATIRGCASLCQASVNGPTSQAAVLIAGGLNDLHRELTQIHKQTKLLQPRPEIRVYGLFSSQNKRKAVHSI